MLPEKKPEEQRTENPTIRVSKSEKKRIDRASQNRGYRYPSRFMRDAVMQVVGSIEDEEAKAKAAAKKKKVSAKR